MSFAWSKRESPAGRWRSPGKRLRLCLRPAARRDREQAAPEQIDYEALRSVYRADKLTPQTSLRPPRLSHRPFSLGMAIHNAALRSRELDAVYLPLLASDLKDFRKATARRYPLAGFSVTIPHKQKILRLLDRMDRRVKLAGRSQHGAGPPRKMGSHQYRCGGHRCTRAPGVPAHGAGIPWGGLSRCDCRHGWRCARRPRPCGSSVAAISPSRGETLPRAQDPGCVISAEEPSRLPVWRRNISIWMIQATSVGMWPRKRGMFSPAGAGQCRYRFRPGL